MFRFDTYNRKKRRPFVAKMSAPQGDRRGSHPRASTNCHPRNLLSGIHSLFFLYYKHSCLFIVISEYICKDTEKRSSLRSKIQDMLPSLFRHSERKRRISYHHPVILSEAKNLLICLFSVKQTLLYVTFY